MSARWPLTRGPGDHDEPDEDRSEPEPEKPQCVHGCGEEVEAEGETCRFCRLCLCPECGAHAGYELAPGEICEGCSDADDDLRETSRSPELWMSR